MKELKTQFENIFFISKYIIKYGTLFSIFLLICAFFSVKHNIRICSVSVYVFAESIISALLFDVIYKRRK